jgi:hypothetical protein
MYHNLSSNEVAMMLQTDENADWSWSGAMALASYLEDLGDSAGVEIEFDLIGIRCDYSEYESILEAAENFNIPLLEEGEDQEEKEAIALKWFENRTTVIQFDGGIILQDF